jgi:hypothetical protein
LQIEWFGAELPFAEEKFQPRSPFHKCGAAKTADITKTQFAFVSIQTESEMRVRLNARSPGNDSQLTCHSEMQNQMRRATEIYDNPLSPASHFMDPAADQRLFPRGRPRPPEWSPAYGDLADPPAQ